MKAKWKTVCGIFSFVKPFVIPYVIGVLLYSSQSFGSSLAISYFISNITAALLTGEGKEIWFSAARYTGILIGYFSILGYCVYLYVRNGELITRNLKNHLFRAFMSASVEGRGAVGEGIASINTEADMAALLYDNCFTGVISCVSSILLSGLVIFWVNPIMGLVALGIGLLTFVVQSQFSKPLEKIAKGNLDANASATKTLSSILMGGASIRIFSLQNKVLGAFETDNKAMLTFSFKEAFISGWRYLFTTVQGWLSLAGVFGVGGYLVATGRMELPALLLVPNLCMTMAMGMSNIGAVWAQMQGPLAAGERALAMIDQGNQTMKITAQKQEYKIIWDQDSTLCFDHVSFRYMGAQADALQDVSLTIPPKTMVAFVGESGSGKSTLLRSVIGLYERDDLAISLGNMNFAQTPGFTWRRQFAYVDQSCTLFAMSVGENIALGKENATREEIVEAAKEAQAHEFISALPQGYDTPCGEKGASLSGGQRQRIAIARALIRKAPILVFDEATASLDAESERQIMQTVNRLRKDHTVLITTHNLSLIEDADAIVVLEAGKLSQMGNHQALLDENGEYARLWHRKEG